MGLKCCIRTRRQMRQRQRVSGPNNYECASAQVSAVQHVYRASAIEETGRHCMISIKKQAERATKAQREEI